MAFNANIYALHEETPISLLSYYFYVKQLANVCNSWGKFKKYGQCFYSFGTATVTTAVLILLLEGFVGTLGKDVYK